MGVLIRKSVIQKMFLRERKCSILYSTYSMGLENNYQPPWYKEFAP